MHWGLRYLTIDVGLSFENAVHGSKVSLTNIGTSNITRDKIWHMCNWERFILGHARPKGKVHGWYMESRTSSYDSTTNLCLMELAFSSTKFGTVANIVLVTNKCFTVPVFQVSRPSQSESNANFI